MRALLRCLFADDDIKIGRTVLFCVLLCGLSVPLLGQPSYPYVIQTVAGSFPLGDNGPATQALLEFPSGVAVDKSGTVYLIDSRADGRDRLVRKISSDGKIGTFFKSDGWPYSIAVDSGGNLLLGEYSIIRRVTPEGVASVVAGTGSGGDSGDNGPAIEARFGSVYAITTDSDGTIYFADSSYHRIRKIGTDGIIRPVAGTGKSGFGGDNGPAALAQLSYPYGLAFDPEGNLYIADYYNFRVRKISPEGIISTFLGTGSYGTSADGTPAKQALIAYPRSLAWHKQSNALLVFDNSSRILRVGPDNLLRTFAGIMNVWGFAGDGGLATAARLDNVPSIAVDANGDVFLADSNNHRIRKVSAGIIKTIAGYSHFSGDGSAATDAVLHRPESLALDPAGNLYIADTLNHRIRKVDSNGVITTFAGTGENGYSGDNGQATAAKLSYPGVLAIDKQGVLYVAGGGRVRKVDRSGTISLVAGDGYCCYGGDGGLATSARFNFIASLLPGPDGLYMSDLNNHRIRKVTPDGIIRTVVGNGTAGYSGDGGLAGAARVQRPHAMIFDKNGDLLFSDSGNHRIRKVTSAGIISTVLGNGNSGLPGNGQDAAGASISGPRGIGLDAAGNLYFLSDYSYILKVIGTKVYRVAGNGAGEFSGDGGLATAAAVRYPQNLVVLDNGDFLIADSQNNRIRKLTLNSPAKFEIVSGSGQTGAPGATLSAPLLTRVVGRVSLPVPDVEVSYLVTAGSARLSAAKTTTDSEGRAGVTITLGDAPGDVVVTATVAGLEPVRFQVSATAALVNPNLPAIRTANGVVTAGAFGGAALIAPGGWIEIYGANLASSLRSWTDSDFLGDQAPTSLDGVTVSFDGKPGYVSFISPGQLNVQVPDGVTAGSVRIIVTTAQGASGAYTVAAATRAPALLAPPAFAVNGVQYVAALFADGYFVGRPDLIPGAPFRPAKPGDTIVLYGVGLGPTEPAQPSGRVVRAAANLRDVSVQIRNSAATVSYAGLVAGIVGLYQVNVIVPAIADGDASLTMLVGGIALSQKNLMLTISK